MFSSTKMRWSGRRRKSHDALENVFKVLIHSNWIAHLCFSIAKNAFQLNYYFFLNPKIKFFFFFVKSKENIDVVFFLSHVIRRLDCLVADRRQHTRPRFPWMRGCPFATRDQTDPPTRMCTCSFQLCTHADRLPLTVTPLSPTVCMFPSFFIWIITSRILFLFCTNYQFASCYRVSYSAIKAGSLEWRYQC